MQKKQFKAESKRLLDLMINSIYTHKEIFLRELISNCSDAIDKMYYKSLTESGVEYDRSACEIRIAANKEARTLTVSDNGIGMTAEEMESNLGTIARSGSLNFKNSSEAREDINIIGQFGVGFYSAFMVADKITVESRAYGSDKAFIWESEGANGYAIKDGAKQSAGTDIILTLKPDTDDEKYSEFLDEHRLRMLVKKYSDFIRYPIKMTVTKSRLKEGSTSDYEDYVEEDTLNLMVPIWRKNKAELTDEDYNNFYEEKHYGFDKPLKHIHITAEGSVDYRAILYIPGRAPYNYYTKEYQKGLELYSNGVLIMNKCAELLPDYFGFVQGLVDSESFSLNISRELLQHDRQLKIIAKRIKEKVKGELLNLLNNDREGYVTFFEQFGRPIKYGLYSSYGAAREELEELLMFYSSKQKKLVTLKEYTEAMTEGQKYIYFASGNSIERLEKLPQTEKVTDDGYDILFLTDDVDEFLLRMLMNYGGKEFKSISDSGDLGLKPTEEKEGEKDADKELFAEISKLLSGKVAKAVPSDKLKSSPVCLSSEGGLSIEMEKTLNAMPNKPGIKAEKVLEINTAHPAFNSLKGAKDDAEKFALYVNLLYDQALLIEGLPVNDPVAFSNNICKLMG